MAYLRDTSRATRLAEIDRHGIEFVSAWRSRLLSRLGQAKISGHLGHLDGHPAAVYLAGGRLWLAVDGQAWHLDEIDATVSSESSVSSGEIRTPLERYTFSVDARNVADDPTAFLDAEDFSFALWTARIVNDLSRQQVLREVLQDVSLATMPEHGTTADTHSVMQMPEWRLDGSRLPSDGERRPD